jgi:nitroimidazol reductase NimA-like FMN-containing flavoprotein (pyridoxamine 5'-phosphate oxidase superfamily)
VTPEQRARQLIEDHNHMTIATADAEGAPWVSPVFYVPDDDAALYWVSGSTARHSANIRARSAVAIVIYEPPPNTDAVYILASAVELDDEAAIRHAIQVLRRKEQPDKWVVHDVADVRGASPWRIYRATPEVVEVRDEIAENGKAIVTRQAAGLLRLAEAD